MIHVWKNESVDTFCGSFEARVSVITADELRRKLHTFGRTATEPTICATCYAAARPKKPQGPRLPKGPKTARTKTPRPKGSNVGKVGSDPWRRFP